MRPILAIASVATLLLSMAGEAAAAANWAPRMERQDTCSWDRPGHNAFMGDVVAAIDRYTDIPTLVRVRLKERMRVRDYDDLVTIRRDQISGRLDYLPEIREMHFGLDKVCRQVTRKRWTDKMQERGLVYCEKGHCILVPTVCRNVSRIAHRPDQPVPPAQAQLKGGPGHLAAPLAGTPGDGATPAPPSLPPPGEAVAAADPPRNTLVLPTSGGVGGYSGRLGTGSNFNDSSAVTARRVPAPSMPTPTSILPPPTWYQTVASHLGSIVTGATNMVKTVEPSAIFCPR
jgi:hypothetical protein